MLLHLPWSSKSSQLYASTLIFKNRKFESLKAGVENVNDRLRGTFFCLSKCIKLQHYRANNLLWQDLLNVASKKYCRMTCIFQQNNNVNTLLFALPFCTENTRDQFLTKRNILFLSLNFSNVFFFNKKTAHKISSSVGSKT